VYPLTGELLTQIVANPTGYSVEIGHWSNELERLWCAVLSRLGSYIYENEKRQQPMVLLQVGMTRWLQALPQFCRQTEQLSDEALRFRNLIRVAQTDPGKVLFEELPRLLHIDENTGQDEIDRRLDSLMTEISNAYLDLQRRLESFAIKESGIHSLTPVQDGANAIGGWLDAIQAENGTSLKKFRFGNYRTEQLVAIALDNRGANGQFWDKLSTAVMGVHLRDWSDQTETSFYNTVNKLHTDVEREVQQLVAEEEVVAITIQLPDETQREFRFRSSDLSSQGKRILQNFKSTMEIAGRPLSADERRQIAVAFLFHMMGETVEA
jgi:hypothetical protein